MTEVAIDAIRVDTTIQLNARGIDQNTVNDYIMALTNGSKFPPVVVFDDGLEKWLADGFHRISAYRFLGHATIEAEVQQGTRDDAKVYAATANATNGKPMSQAEKREAGKRLLKLTMWNNSEIARRLGLDEGTVRKWRGPSSENSEDSERLVTRNGTTYTMDTSNIGKSDEPEPDTSPMRLVDPDSEPEPWPITREEMDAIDREFATLTEEPEPEADTMAVHYSSETPEWYTPQDFLELVTLVLGRIDLDPCSNSATSPNVEALRHYTTEDDGLIQLWDGRVFMNPPYGRELSDWVEKLVREYQAGRVTEAIALVPSRTDTAWFRELRDFPRCFINGRMKFSGYETAAPFPSMAVYLGSKENLFAEVFAEIGDIYKRVV